MKSKPVKSVILLWNSINPSGHPFISYFVLITFCPFFFLEFLSVSASNNCFEFRRFEMNRTRRVNWLAGSSRSAFFFFLLFPLLFPFLFFSSFSVDFFVLLFADKSTVWPQPRTGKRDSNDRRFIGAATTPFLMQSVQSSCSRTSIK